ncbi:2OG-Fe(II) oxygenase [Phenylobacterium sp.]|uniref:2OG-Fe(II) oxygenase n=1 Tax=Phenylobacterium sp. TaxID=1871053 RepID=UPI0025E49D4B|nr:2OG-Fe(II) oxygenase [Phenylobacterium sp.]
MALLAGAPAPMFTAPSHVNPEFAFSSLGGRYVLLAFLPPPGPERDQAIELVLQHRAAFADDQRIFFGVLPDEASYRAREGDRPPLRWFGDWTGDIRRLFHAEDAAGHVVPQWVVLDPSMRVLGTAPLAEGARTLAGLIRLGAPDDHAGVPLSAPVLIVPRVFEPDLCRRLIGLYQAQGGVPSGVMRERGGRTIGVLDAFKKRRDAVIEEPGLLAEVRGRLARRLLPEIEKAFQFKATRVERFIVACYDAEEGGYFRAHRDNTTGGTAHRRFAVSINLNAEAFEGGDLRFPEFGSRTYRPPTGGAVVFSCSLLHEATPVTRGIRYAFLPFLYDEAAAELRARNLHLLAPSPDTAAG